MKYLIIVARVNAATVAVVHLYDVAVNVRNDLHVLTCLYNPYNIPKVGVLFCYFMNSDSGGTVSLQYVFFVVVFSKYSLKF